MASRRCPFVFVVALINWHVFDDGHFLDHRHFFDYGNMLNDRDVLHHWNVDFLYDGNMFHMMMMDVMYMVWDVDDYVSEIGKNVCRFRMIDRKVLKSLKNEEHWDTFY